jgi:hypothetical protein
VVKRTKINEENKGIHSITVAVGDEKNPSALKVNFNIELYFENNTVIPEETTEDQGKDNSTSGETSTSGTSETGSN